MTEKTYTEKAAPAFGRLVTDVFDGQSNFNLSEAYQIFVCGALWMITLGLDELECSDFIQEMLPDDDEIQPNSN